MLVANYTVLLDGRINMRVVVDGDEFVASGDKLLEVRDRLRSMLYETGTSAGEPLMLRCVGDYTRSFV